MANKQLTPATAQEWKKFCKEHYAAYKRKNPPPFIASFWSGSAFFNAYEHWSSEYTKEILRLGNSFWEEYGYKVVDWNVGSSQPITIQPIANV